jgi:hypothetical protein
LGAEGCSNLHVKNGLSGKSVLRDFDAVYVSSARAALEYQFAASTSIPNPPRNEPTEKSAARDPNLAAFAEAIDLGGRGLVTKYAAAAWSDKQAIKRTGRAAAIIAGIISIPRSL